MSQLRLNEEDYKRLISRPDIGVISDTGGSYEKDIDFPIKRKNLLNARKTELDGFIFDSGLEAKRYKFLRQLESNGLIENLDCEHKRVGKRTKEAIKQHRWILQEKFNYEKAIVYTDDFQYEIPGIGLVVEDVKGGFVTASFKKSAKMFRYKYPNVNFFINYEVNGFYTK